MTKKGGSFPTKLCRQGARIELTSFELQHVENDLQANQGLAHPPVGGRQLVQRFGFDQFGLFRPIQGEPIKSCEVALVRTHPEEEVFPTLEEVLEEG